MRNSTQSWAEAVPRSIIWHFLSVKFYESDLIEPRGAFAIWICLEEIEGLNHDSEPFITAYMESL